MPKIYDCGTPSGFIMHILYNQEMIKAFLSLSGSIDDEIGRGYKTESAHYNFLENNF